jgi:DNA polymerase III epsilon subunit-like protein
MNPINFNQWLTQTFNNAAHNAVKSTKTNTSIYHSIFAKQTNLTNNFYQDVTKEYLEFCLDSLLQEIKQTVELDFDSKSRDYEFIIKTEPYNIPHINKGNTLPTSTLEVAHLYESAMQLRLWQSNNLVFLDIETDGLNINNCNILQIAIIKAYDTSFDVWKTYIKPHNQYQINESSPAFKVNKISQSLIQNSPTFQQVAKNISSLLHNKTIVGFNIDTFDIPILKNALNKATGHITWKNTIDIANLYWNGHNRTSLLKTMQELKIHVPYQLHDAETDAKACIFILSKMIAKGIIPNIHNKPKRNRSESPDESDKRRRKENQRNYNSAEILMPDMEGRPTYWG